MLRMNGKHRSRVPNPLAAAAALLLTVSAWVGVDESTSAGQLAGEGASLLQFSVEAAIENPLQDLNTEVGESARRSGVSLSKFLFRLR